MSDTFLYVEVTFCKSKHFFGMRHWYIALLSGVVALMIAPLGAAAQDTKEPPSPEEMASTEADRLAKVLDLEDWQLFYVDSTLQHDYAALQAEYNELQRLKATNSDLYLSSQDKWMEQIDKTFKGIFTDEQWAQYLKSGAAKMQKAREKRRLKAEKAAAKFK